MFFSLFLVLILMSYEVADVAHPTEIIQQLYFRSYMAYIGRIKFTHLKTIRYTIFFLIRLCPWHFFFFYSVLALNTSRINKLNEAI